jgi:hypothetical protein
MGDAAPQAALSKAPDDHALEAPRWNWGEVECHDQAPGFPVIREASAEAENGRGLMMVAALTGGQWGWSETPGGKCVWAQLISE